MEAVILLSTLACIPAYIAYNKGRSFLLWFAYGFVFWLIALIHSLFIKPNANAEGYKACKDCGSVIEAAAKRCKFCTAEQ